MKQEIYYRRRDTALAAIEKRLGTSIMATVRDKQTAEVELLEAVAAAFAREHAADTTLERALTAISEVSGVGDKLFIKIKEAVAAEFGDDDDELTSFVEVNETPDDEPVLVEVDETDEEADDDGAAE